MVRIQAGRTPGRTRPISVRISGEKRKGRLIGRPFGIS